MSGVNPQGVEVSSFKAPSSEELDHDYLWRCMQHLPERGRIGIFNRSYYEEVLVARVHEAVLAKQKLPPSLVTPSIWQERYEDIGAFERYLSRNGIVVVKVFLNVSRDEQKKRFLDRLTSLTRTGSSSLAMSGNAASGTTISAPTRTRSGRRPHPMRPGMSFQPITNGSRGWPSPRC